MIFVKPENNDWVDAKYYEEGAVLISSRILDAWQNDNKGLDLSEFKDEYEQVHGKLSLSYSDNASNLRNLDADNNLIDNAYDEGIEQIQLTDPNVDPLDFLNQINEDDFSTYNSLDANSSQTLNF